MQPPYIPHDAPFRTLRELLSVRDMPPNLFLGEDANVGIMSHEVGHGLDERHVALHEE